jgi:hypothetical protein
MNPWAKGLQQAADLLIKRGSAMGSLLPVLLLVPFFLGSAWLFREQQIISGILILAALGIVTNYCRHFAKFANTDPDRLQSEEYRYEMTRIQMIAAKELPYPISAESLNLPAATSNPSHPFPRRDATDVLDADSEGREQK